ncbi:unnamed protein product [Sphagnum compactum]
MDAAAPAVSTVHAPAVLDPPIDIQRHNSDVNTHIQTGAPISPPLAAVAPVAAPAAVPAHAADEEGRSQSQQPRPPPPGPIQLQPPVQPVSVPMSLPPSYSTQSESTSLLQPVESQPKTITEIEHHQHHVQETAAPTVVPAKKRRPRRAPAAEALNDPVITRSGREVKANPRYMHPSMVDVAEQCHLYAYRTTVAQSMPRTADTSSHVMRQRPCCAGDRCKFSRNRWRRKEVISSQVFLQYISWRRDEVLHMLKDGVVNNYGHVLK